MDRKKIMLSSVLAGQRVGVMQVEDQIWQVSFVNAGRNFPTLAGRIFPHPWEFWAVSPALKTGTPF
jgi:hypothetical protein